MPALDFPRPLVVPLRELASRLLDSRKPKTDNAMVARDLLAGFYEICARAGQDRLLAELNEAFPAEPTPAPVAEDGAAETAAEEPDAGAVLADHPVLVPALVAQLGTLALDDGGPRNQKPLQLTDCVVAALGLTVVDEPDRTIALDDDVRAAVMAAMAKVIEPELAVPQIREAIIAQAREACPEELRGVFHRIAAQLDERGVKLNKTPKVPLHALHAILRVVRDVRVGIVDRVARTAIDRAQALIAAAAPEAAARIDQPVTFRATPREIAVARATDARVPLVPAAVAGALLDGLSELARIGWRAPTRPVRTYGARATFAVGELVAHPKFGRGEVTAIEAQRVVIEFDDGPHTLAHVGAVSASDASLSAAPKAARTKLVEPVAADAAFETEPE